MPRAQKRAESQGHIDFSVVLETDLGTLRRGLARLNDIGLIEPVTLADVVVTRHADGETADMTIPLRKRGWRSWSLAGPIVPGLESYQASISSRLPERGRDALDAST